MHVLHVFRLLWSIKKYRHIVDIITGPLSNCTFLQNNVCSTYSAHFSICQPSHVFSDTACSRGFARMKGLVCEGKNIWQNERAVLLSSKIDDRQIILSFFVCVSPCYVLKMSPSLQTLMSVRCSLACVQMAGVWTPRAHSAASVLRVSPWTVLDVLVWVRELYKQRNHIQWNWHFQWL